MNAFWAADENILRETGADLDASTRRVDNASLDNIVFGLVRVNDGKNDDEQTVTAADPVRGRGCPTGHRLELDSNRPITVKPRGRVVKPIGPLRVVT